MRFGCLINSILYFIIFRYFISIPDSEKSHINLAKLRLKFPFLLRDRFEGRAKRSARTIKDGGPLLVNSWRAHLQTISSLAYIAETEIIVR